VSASPLWLRRAVLVGVALALVVLTATASNGGATGSRVLVIGDSILHLSQPDVTAALSAEGWQPVVDGRPGLSIETFEPIVASDAAIARPDVAVVELGTNDCDTTCDNLGPAIDTVMDQLVSHGARAVYWLNVQTAPTRLLPGPPRVYPAHADYVNYAIEQAAVRWPQMKVVDFRDLFDQHPEWHLADGLHPNAIGQQELATLIAATIHR
jgi:hypothetical protein